MQRSILFLLPALSLGLTGMLLILALLLCWQFPSLLESLTPVIKVLLLAMLSLGALLLGIVLRWRTRQREINEGMATEGLTLLLAPRGYEYPRDTSDFFRRFPVNILPKRSEMPVPHISVELTRFQEKLLAFSLRVPEQGEMVNVSAGEVLVDWPGTEIAAMPQDTTRLWPPSLEGTDTLVDIPTYIRGRSELLVCAAPLLLSESSLQPPHEQEIFHDKIKTLLRALDQLAEDSIAGVQYLIRPAPRTALWQLEATARRLRTQLLPTKEVRRPLEEDKLKKALSVVTRRLEDKASLYEVVVMVWAAHSEETVAKARVTEIGRKLAGEYRGERNQARLGRIRVDRERMWSRAFPSSGGFLLTAHELNNYLHLPSAEVLKGVPRLRQAGAFSPPVTSDVLRQEKPDNWRTYGTYREAKGKTYYVGHPFKNTQTNTMIVGSTGSGKSTLLKNIIMQDWLAGNGVLVIDPKQDLAADLLSLVPQERVDKVIQLDLTQENPFRFNMLLAGYSPKNMGTSATNVMEAIQMGMGDNWDGAVTMREILYNGILLVLCAAGRNSSLMMLYRVINDGTFRQQLMRDVKGNAAAKPALHFWQTQFPSREKKEQVRSIQVVNRRLDAVLASGRMRRVLAFNPSSIDISKLLEEGYLILAPMPNRLSAELVRIWSALLVREYMHTALAREETKVSERERVYRRLTLVVDELAQTIGHFPEMIKKLLSIGRAFKSGSVLATQFYAQLPEDVLDTLQENALTQIGFRVGETEKRRMVGIMGGGIGVEDVVRLKQYHAYIVLAEAGGQSDPVLIKTHPPKTPPVGEGISFGSKPEKLPRDFSDLIKNRWPKTLEVGATRLAYINKLLALPEREGLIKLAPLSAQIKERLALDPTAAFQMRNDALLDWLDALGAQAVADILSANTRWQAWQTSQILHYPELVTSRETRIKMLSRVQYGVPWWEGEWRYRQQWQQAEAGKRPRPGTFNMGQV